MCIKRLLLIVFFFVSLKTFGQSDPNKYLKSGLIAPSPTAANLGKYGDLPVTLYTGSIAPNIPLFTVKGQDLEVPLTLSYNYSGLKPREQVSWIGLGWSLQAGGVITRNVRGNVDGYNSPNNNSLFENQTGLNMANDSSYDQNYLKNTAELAQYDTEPDVYSFNFGSNSGKFIIYRNKVYTFPSRKIKIERNGTTSFTITTEDGIIYRFAETEYTRPKHNANGPNLNDYVSAWYLTEIKNPSQTESIKFTYIPEANITQLGAVTQSYRVPNEHTKPATLYNAAISLPTFVDCKRLESITSEKYTVQFIQESSPRTDVQQGSMYALKSIRVTSSDSRMVKSYDLHHSYFGTGQMLKLDSLSENSIPDDSIFTTSRHQRYYFKYQDGTFPTTFDSGTDHWGFYNGESSNVLIPNTIYPTGPSRMPKFEYCQIGALKSITYPTGGRTTFNYEQNRLQTDGTLQIPHNISKELYRTPPGSTNLLEAFGTFNLNVAQYIDIDVGRAPVKHNGDFYDGIIKPKDNPNTELQVWNDDVLVFQAHVSDTVNHVTWNHDPKFDSKMPPGNYSYHLVCDASENDVNMSIRYVEATNIPNSEAGPGIRVRSVTNEPLNGIPVTKTYTYSSAIGLMPTYSARPYTEWEAEANNPFVYKPFYYVTYGSYLSQSQNLGLPFYYPTVTEEVGSDTSKLSRTVYTFGNFDNGSNFMGAEPLSEMAYLKRNGTYSLLHSKIYEYSFPRQDTIIFAIKPYVSEGYTIKGGLGTSNIYKAETYFLTPSWKYTKSVTETSYDGQPLVSKTTYAYNLKTHNLQQTTTQNSDGTTTVQKNKYPEDYTIASLDPLKSAHILSVPIETQVWRKSSATDSVMMAGTLTEYNNTVLKPSAVYAFESINGKNSLNNELTDTTKKYLTFLSDSAYKIKATINYDSFGRLVSQKRTSGPGVSYQWAYHALQVPEAGKKAYAIAEGKNLLNTEFFTENFEDTTGSNIVSGSQAHTGLQYYNGTSYTINWTRPTSPVRSYVITYWALTNNKWVYNQAPYTAASYTCTGGTAYDDIRIYPADAQLTTYTYLPGVGLSSATDAKGNVSYYEYDDFQRLLNIKDQDKRIIKNITYNTIKLFPVWTDTGIKRCVQGQYGNTGEQEKEQKDTNPNSGSYNTTAWVSVGVNTTSGTGCPIAVPPLYVRKRQISIRNTVVDTYPQRIDNYALNVYADRDCTVPYAVLTPLTINYTISTNSSTNGVNTNTVTNYTATVQPGFNSVNIGDIIITGCHTGGAAVAAAPQPMAAKSGVAQPNTVPGGGDPTNATCDVRNIDVVAGTGYTPIFP